jgi:probable rRNA maturation factor
MGDEMDPFSRLSFGDDQPVESRILFHSEDVDFQLNQTALIRDWINETIQAENAKLEQLNIIFCSDSFLLQVNLEYLEHDTFTDIITFHYSSLPDIEGDLFISIDRILENARQFQVDAETELHRVIIHGVLHLCGYGDKTKEEIQVMRQKENAYLELLTKKKGVG